MMGESCVCLGSKEIWVFGSFRPFFKIFEILEKFEKLSKWTKNSNFFAPEAYTLHNSLPSFWAKFWSLPSIYASIFFFWVLDCSTCLNWCKFVCYSLKFSVSEKKSLRYWWRNWTFVSVPATETGFWSHTNKNWYDCIILCHMSISELWFDMVWILSILKI